MNDAALMHPPDVVDDSAQLTCDTLSPEHLGEAVTRWAHTIDAFTTWMIAAGYRRRTVEIRRYYVRRLAEAHLSRSPWRVTGDELVTWVASQRWSPETRKSVRASLRCFYMWGRQQRHARRDPTVSLAPVRVPPTVPRPCPEHVLVSALAEASDRDRLMLMHAALAGLRRAEIAGLRWDDYDLTTNEIWVRGKGGRVRVVPLHPRLRTELDAELTRRELRRFGTGWRYGSPRSEFLFPGQTGGHMSAGHVGKVVSRLLGPGWSAHRLRSRFLTGVYEGSGDLLLTQELAGHADPKTTRGYVAVNQARAATVVAALH